MKIGDSKPVSRLGSVAKRSVVSDSGAAAPAARSSDVISIMGIPEAELTPKVRTAIMSLLQEVDLFFGEIERRFDQRAQPDDALAQGVDLL